MSGAAPAPQPFPEPPIEPPPVSGVREIGSAAAETGEAVGTAAEVVETGMTAGEIALLAGRVALLAVAGAAVVVGVAYVISEIAERLDEGEPSTACATCAAKIPCFNPPEGANAQEDAAIREEMKRQLAEQQGAINKMSPDKILENLERMDAEGRPNDSYKRELARREAWNERHAREFDDLLAEGKSVEEADSIAQERATEWMKGKDATHDLDWIAGGSGTITGLGSSKVNRSIGSQWGRRRKSDADEPDLGQRRRDALRKAAEAAKAAGKKTMDVELSVC